MLLGIASRPPLKAGREGNQSHLCITEELVLPHKAYVKLSNLIGNVPGPLATCKMA
jgi:hypothetical protein